MLPCCWCRPSDGGNRLRMNPHLNIRGRLLLLVLVTLLPVGTLLIYRAVEDHRRAARAAQRDALTLARLVAAEQLRVIDSTKSLLSGAVLAPVITSGNRPAIDAYLAKLLAQHPQFANVFIIGVDGRTTASAIPSQG